MELNEIKSPILNIKQHTYINDNTKKQDGQMFLFTNQFNWNYIKNSCHYQLHRVKDDTDETAT